LDLSGKHDIQAALGKARVLLEDCQINSIPVDLSRLAKYVGIRRVTEIDTRLDGQLFELETGGYEVALSRSAPASRKRFTLAHEIAHLLLFPHQATHHAGRETEDLCNVAAAELLIPSRILARFFPVGHAVGIRSFLKVPRLFRCSMEAAGWKIFNSGFVSGALLMWRIEGAAGGGFLELVAIPHTWGAERVGDQGLRVFPGDWLWQEVMTSEQGPIRFPSRHPNMCYHGEFIRLRKMVLILVSDGLHRLGNTPGPARPSWLPHRDTGLQRKL
jgi:hypothetical protein